MSDAAALMDRMYRRQRHIYDLSRKFYLLGRDEAIAGLDAAARRQRARDRLRHRTQSRQTGAGLSRRRGCSGSTSRARCWRARAASVARAGLSARVALGQGDATAFDPEALFGCAQFDRVMISYALSMIPPWRKALARALDVVAPGGSLHLVDFGDCAGLPGPFRTGLRQWLAAFEVVPRDDLGHVLRALAAERGMTCTIETRFRGYAVLAVARRSARPMPAPTARTSPAERPREGEDHRARPVRRPACR